MVQEVFKSLIKVQPLSWIHMHKSVLAIIRHLKVVKMFVSELPVAPTIKEVLL